MGESRPTRLSTENQRPGLAGGWLVMDFFDVIVHVMRTDVRQRYDLESLWGDAPRVKARTRSRKTEA